MIDRKQLLADLQKLLVRLEADLLQRSESAEVPQVGKTLRADYEQAKAAARTAQNYEDWRSDSITQAAAAWVLSCVFVRFLEDNRLIEPAKIAGPGERLRQARDEWELYLAKNSAPNERDYLLSVFDALAALPGTKDVFGDHNPIRELPNWLSGDAARDLLNFFQKINAETGLLIHDFTDPAWDTRFLGDLYQDLSEAARKKYALLQTPEFVEEFILDRTLDPALDEFGLDAPPVLGIDNQPMTQPGFRMIDPACGSGHFLLGGFRRILGRWQKKEPAAKTRHLVQRTLDSIYGVDLNPYAVAIARFRLLLVAMRACGITRLADAPAFHLNLACGDSLLHGPGSAVQGTLGDIAEAHHAYQPEDLPLLRKYLTPGVYHAVVANPPYIVPRDKALNDAYRERYKSCHRQYSLAVPFMERIFRLAVAPTAPDVPKSDARAGYSGQITANSFMKREFGKKLIEQFLPQIDLTHVIDTSGAYIPGHGTPTVILFGRNRQPVTRTIRTIMGIRGEPSTPEDPARGLVWTSIVEQIDQAGSQNDFASVGDSPRENFHKHPWSIGGGGAAELKELLDSNCDERIADVAEWPIGRGVRISEESAFTFSTRQWARRRLSPTLLKRLAKGEDVRDWGFQPPNGVFYPYSDQANGVALADVLKLLWPMRTCLRMRPTFNGTFDSSGLRWYEYQQHTPSAYKTPMSLIFANIATHNHFTIDRGGTVFDCTAPVIKLPMHGTENELLDLQGLLNSSIASFWLKQVAHNKGSAVDEHGARQRTVPFEDFYAYNGTTISQFPVPSERPGSLAKQIDELSQCVTQLQPSELVGRATPTNHLLVESRRKFTTTLGIMVAIQEELDWECYRLYGVLGDSPRSETPPSLLVGQRAFEIVMARKMASGKLDTTWFARHGSTPIVELPAEWDPDYRRLVERRIEIIESNDQIALIEQPEYKRRWNTESWESQLERALREWLLGRLESYFDFDGRMNDAGRPTAQLDISLVSVAQLADVARRDAEFMQVGELYRDDPAFDVQSLVNELVSAESVPLLPVLRYKPSGLIKHGTWERTWDLQRQEDAIDARTTLPSTDPKYLTEDAARDLKQKQVGKIPPPTKYDSKDFLNSNYWNLRGKLDVPKERWISFPHCEGADGTLMIAWAGYDHLQLAQAISAHYMDVQERLGGRDDPRLVPLLGCLIELLPWIKQWHNEPDVAFDGMRMGDYFEGFINEEARRLGKTVDDIKAWTPPQRSAGRGRRRAAT